MKTPTHLDCNAWSWSNSWLNQQALSTLSAIQAVSDLSNRLVHNM